MSDLYTRRIGALQVWWHRTGPRGGDHPESMDVHNMMGARSISQAYERDPKYHAVRIMRWDGFEWHQLAPPETKR